MTTEQMDALDGERAWGPIPRYAMLDIWMAIYGSEKSEAFQPFADEHGYAETWARLCADVRVQRREPPEFHCDICQSSTHDAIAHQDAGITLARAEEITQAEEPIDERLRRSWLNGFTEGVNRGSRGDRWDR